MFHMVFSIHMEIETHVPRPMSHLLDDQHRRTSILVLGHFLALQPVLIKWEPAFTSEQGAFLMSS